MDTGETGAEGPALEPLGPDDPHNVAGYQLAARLGAGGMGKVYLTHTPGGRPLALKVIRPEFAENEEFRRRFRREARAAQRVQGLFTAPVIDANTDGAQPWLATAYVPGPSLARVVADYGSLPTESVLLLMTGVAEALQAIHGAGVVHRDLKPANVLLASDGPRVIDFGVAWSDEATALTNTGFSVGTPAFMSPEQGVGEAVSGASDIFSLGLVAGFAAQGTPPFGNGTSHALVYRIIHQEPDLSALPEAIRPVVASCLAKSPEDRPSTAEIISRCRQAAELPRAEEPEDWLPAPVASDLIRRDAAQLPTQSAQPGVAGPAPPPPPTAPSGGPPPAPGMPGGPPYPMHGAAVTGPSPWNGWHPGYPPARPMPPPKRRRSGKIPLIIAAVLSPLVVASGCGALVDGLWSSGDTSPPSGVDPESPQKTQPRPKTYSSLQLPDGHHLKFANDPPKPQRNNEDDFYFLCGGAECEVGAYATELTMLEKKQRGSFEKCRQNSKPPVDRIPLSKLSKGRQICAVTDSGTVALLTYQGRSNGEMDGSSSLSLDLKVWRDEPPE